MKLGYSIHKKIILKSDYSVLVDVENLVNNVCEQLHLSEESYGNILIAITEAVNNAIEHGNAKAMDRNIVIQVFNSENGFCFNIIDEGNGFDYKNLPDPTSPENILKEDGRGVFLMKNLSDEVEFEDPGNSVLIYFNK